MLEKVDSQTWSDKQSWYRNVYFQDTETKSCLHIDIRWDKSYPLQSYGKSEFLTNYGWKLLYTIPSVDVKENLDDIETRILKKSVHFLNINKEDF
jgi:hypothetical protein